MPSPLPVFTQAGVSGTWEFTDRHGSAVRLEGDFLGMGSSHRPYHKHTFPPYADQGQHCSTCRWMEIRVFQEAENGRYLVLQRGASIVPGEEDIITFGWAEDGPAVISAMSSWDKDGRAFFTFVARRALETASALDDGLDRAYQQALERVITK